MTETLNFEDGVLQAREYKNPVGTFTLELQDYEIKPSRFKTQDGDEQKSVALVTKIIDPGEFQGQTMRVFITVPAQTGFGPGTLPGRVLGAFRGQPVEQGEPVNLRDLRARRARVTAELREYKVVKNGKEQVWSRPVANKDELSLVHAGYGA